MRSYLFVPGDSERKLSKVVSSEADAIVLDLEDAVAGERKGVARELVAAFLRDAGTSGRTPPLYVRVNGVASDDVAADLDSLAGALPSGVLLPKVTSLQDVMTFDASLSSLEQKAGAEPGSIRLIVMVSETPQSVLNMGQYVDVPERTTGFAWSGEDLAASLGAKDNRDDNGQYRAPYRLARSLSLMAAAAARVQPIDAVFADFRDHDGLKEEALCAAFDGFGGKLAIHPDQVAIINEAFTPSDEDIDRAQAIVSAFATEDIGVVGVGNKMKDLPNLIMARNVLERARLAGKQ